MSLERAAVNCKRCYELAQRHKAWNDKLDPDGIFRDNKVYQARNDAMKALEDDMARMMIDKEAVLEGLPQEPHKALTHCSLCDYTSPQLYDLYQKSLKISEEKGDLK